LERVLIVIYLEIYVRQAIISRNCVFRKKHLVTLGILGFLEKPRGPQDDLCTSNERVTTRNIFVDSEQDIS